MPQLSRIVFWTGIVCLIIGFGFHGIHMYDEDLKAGYARPGVRKTIIIGGGIILVGFVLLIISFVI